MTGTIMMLGVWFVGFTLINRTMDGLFLTAEDVSILNNLLGFRPFDVFGVFTISIPNISFITNGLVHLVRFDYSFFGGNAAIITWFLSAIGMAVSFGLFLSLIGVAWGRYMYASR